MSANHKVGIILGSILAVLVVGGMGMLVLEQGVKAEYASLDPNSPCIISGTGFDNRAQEQACNSYLAQKQQKQVDIHNYQNSMRPEEARTQLDLSPSGLKYNKDMIQPVSEQTCSSIKQKVLNTIDNLDEARDGYMRNILTGNISYSIGNLEVYCGLDDADWRNWK